jgi:hypothetical protein
MIPSCLTVMKGRIAYLGSAMRFLGENWCSIVAKTVHEIQALYE